jgi:predicted enzyme related to lactoylglutathione lyase
MNPLLRKVDAVTITVPDLDQALAFYRDRLGHSLLWRNDSTGQAALAMPDSDTELVLAIAQTTEPNWLVDSVEEAAAAFVSGGGSVLVEPVEIPIGQLAVVRDPFGNIFTVLDLSKGRYMTDEDGTVTGIA